MGPLTGPDDGFPFLNSSKLCVFMTSPNVIQCVCVLMSQPLRAERLWFIVSIAARVAA